tara:strand:- start:2409 stop:8195 length:5787 start_codon:yes stop_codon:yes gene_type:complete
MGFFDRVGGVVGGVIDVVGGGAEFVYDTGRALAKATTDPGEGIKIFVDSVQEDLLGQVIGGAFGPEGIVGSVVGGLPEFVRKPFRTVLEPTMEAWDWTIQNAVDRPLGTLATVINAGISGTDISELFDGSTWASAWEINDKRTFGQSVAAAIYNIDPFDEDAYNDIREDSLFNLISGTADFFQEFADPMAIALGGGANILRGKTVIASLDNAGNVVTHLGRSNFEKMGGIIAPQKIYTPGGGIFKQTLLGKPRLNDQQIAARNLVGQQVVSQRINGVVGADGVARGGYLNSKGWQKVEQAMDEVSADYVKASNGFDGSGVLLPDAAKIATDKRFSILRETLSRKGSRMPEEAAFAIANGATPQARRLNARFVMGDMSVFREVGEAATAARALMTDDSFLSAVNDLDDVRQLIADSENVEKAVTKELKAEKARLEKEVAEKSAGLNDVDWVTMYDGYLGVIESQGRKVFDENGQPTLKYPDILGTNADLQDLTEMMLRRIAGLENMKVAQLKSIAEPTASVAKVYTDAFGDYFTRSINRLEKRFGDRKDINGGYEEYYVRSVVNPLGFRKLRFFSERNPQALIDFQDTQAFTQFERMLQAASRVKIPGKVAGKARNQRIITRTEIDQLLGEWARITARGSDPVQFKQLFDNTVDNLSRKADELISKTSKGMKSGLADNMIEARKQIEKQIDEKLTIGDSLQSGRTINEASQARKGMDTDRPGRRTISATNKQTTYRVQDPETKTIHTIMTGMTPQQMRQSGVMPRWDLVNTEINRTFNKFGNRRTRTLQKTKDGARLVGTSGSSLATSTMQIWRPFVLLTPKWPGRVQLDETLRRAADLGVMNELRNLIGGFGDMRNVYATRGVEMGLDDFVPKIFDEAVEQNANVKNLGDALRHYESKGVTIDNLIDKTVKEINLNQTKVDKFVPKPTQQLMTKAGLARLAIGSALFGFTPAIAWSTIYGARRYQRVRNVARRQAGLTVAEGLQVEARKLLSEALENGDAGLRQQAETMLSRADGMREAIDVITPEGVSIENIDDITDNLERAHVLMDKAGMANMSVYGATLRNGYGDTADFREIISASVSSTRSTSSLMQGVTQAQKREILRFVDADWELWDITSASTTKSQYVKGWDALLGRATKISDRHPEFYKLAWSDDVEGLAKLLRENADLRARLGLTDAIKYHTEPDVVNFTQKARDIIDEFNEILPAGYGFDDLRAKAAAGGNVTWNEVETILRKDFKEQVDAGFYAPTTDLKFIVEQFREQTGITNFGKSTSPNMRTIDYGRGAFTGAMGEFVENMFKILGETPADQLSRNPYYRTKYEREVNRRLALYTDADGMVNISQKSLTKIEDQARKSALKETRDLLYDLAEETRFAEITANIFPFFNAWQEVLGRWSKLATENPYFVGKMVNMYQTPWNAKYLGMEEVYQYDEAKIAERREELGRDLTDEEKREFATQSYIVFRLPQPVKNLASVLTPGPLSQALIDNDIRFSKEGLASMLQSTTPGVGPLASIPIRQAVLEDPSLEDTFKFMFPFGHPEGGFFEQTFASFAPAYAQNLRNIYMDTPAKKRQVTYFFKQVLTEYEQSTPGGISSLLGNEQWVLQRVKESEERAEQFFMFRSAAGLFSPTSTTMLSPYADLMEQIKELQRQHGYDEGTALFLEEHGEEFVYLTSRMTKLNDGVAASAVSEEAYIKYQDLVQSHPEIGAWVTLSLGGKDEEYLFNQAAYRRQTTMDVSPLTPGLKRRELKSPKALIEGVDVSEGWTKYTELSDFIRTIQDDRQALGLPYSLNSTAMSDLQRFKQEQIDLIRQEHPLWGEAWDAGRDEGKMARVIEGFVVALSDDKFSDLTTTRPSARHLIDYFELRGFIEQELVRRHAEENGSLNLESGTNADLLLFWQREKEELSKRPEFSVVYDRYFENDMIPKNSFVSLMKV